MIEILDNNGNKITIYNAWYQSHEDSGKIHYYNNVKKEKWVATITTSGTVILTSEASYSITKAAKPSLDSIIADIADCGTRYKLDGYQLRTIKNHLRKFNSKTMQWNSELKNINL